MDPSPLLVSHTTHSVWTRIKLEVWHLLESLSQNNKEKRFPFVKVATVLIYTHSPGPLCASHFIAIFLKSSQVMKHSKVIFHYGIEITQPSPFILTN